MKRPRIIINCAMSADGKISLPNRKQIRISSEEDMQRVHQLRNSCDAVLVGIGAVLQDDPKLTVKKTYVNTVLQPIRIVLDSCCKTPINALVVNEKAPTIICCHENKEHKQYADNVQLLFCAMDNDQRLDLHDVLLKLTEKGIQSILVEGGGTVIWHFLKEKLVDDLYIYIGPMIIGGKQTPTMADGEGILKEDEVLSLVLKNIKPLGKGVLLQYQLQK